MKKFKKIIINNNNTIIFFNKFHPPDSSPNYPPVAICHLNNAFIFRRPMKNIILNFICTKGRQFKPTCSISKQEKQKI